MRYFRGDIVMAGSQEYRIGIACNHDMYLCDNENGFTFFGEKELTLIHRPLLNRLKAVIFR